MEKKTETPRTQNREWGFFGTCASNGHADPEAAWDEAMAALTDPKGRFRLSPENARDLLDATWGRHLADQVVGTKIAKAIAGLAEDGWDKDARNFVRKHINPNLEADRKTADRDEALAAIAMTHGDFDAALRAAYEAGRRSARRAR